MGAWLNVPFLAPAITKAILGHSSHTYQQYTQCTVLAVTSSHARSPLPPGYGFVDFESPADALKAVQALQASGVLAQFAKVPQV